MVVSLTKSKLLEEALSELEKSPEISKANLRKLVDILRVILMERNHLEQLLVHEIPEPGILTSLDDIEMLSQYYNNLKATNLLSLEEIRRLQIEKKTRSVGTETEVDFILYKKRMEALQTEINRLYQQMSLQLREIEILRLPSSPAEEEKQKLIEINMQKNMQKIMETEMETNMQKLMETNMKLERELEIVRRELKGLEKEKLENSSILEMQREFEIYRQEQKQQQIYAKNVIAKYFSSSTVQQKALRPILMRLFT